MTLFDNKARACIDLSTDWPMGLVQMTRAHSVGYSAASAAAHGGLLSSLSVRMTASPLSSPNVQHNPSFPLRTHNAAVPITSTTVLFLPPPSYLALPPVVFLVFNIRLYLWRFSGSSAAPAWKRSTTAWPVAKHGASHSSVVSFMLGDAEDTEKNPRSIQESLF